MEHENMLIAAAILAGLAIVIEIIFRTKKSTP
jgi:hypothetical protein